MAKSSRPTNDARSPDDQRESVDDPGGRSAVDLMMLHQTMMEVQKEVTVNTTELKRALSDITALDSKMTKLASSFTWFRGFFAAAAIFIPAFMGLIWWLIGGQITDLKNDLLKRPPASVEAPR